MEPIADCLAWRHNEREREKAMDIFKTRRRRRWRKRRRELTALFFFSFDLLTYLIDDGLWVLKTIYSLIFLLFFPPSVGSPSAGTSLPHAHTHTHVPCPNWLNLHFRFPPALSPRVCVCVCVRFKRRPVSFLEENKGVSASRAKV